MEWFAHCVKSLIGVSQKRWRCSARSRQTWGRDWKVFAADSDDDDEEEEEEDVVEGGVGGVGWGEVGGEGGGGAAH